jgi:hypothetical protein
MEQATRCTPRRKRQERNRRAKRFQMIMNILPVAAELNLGVTWCILNDRALGSIRDTQTQAFNGRTACC